MWCLSHEGTEDLDEVSDIMETALFRDLIDMGVGVLQEARRLLHAIGIDIIEWRLAGHASEEADEVLLVQAGELRQVPDIDFLLVVRTDVLDGLLDGEHLFLRLALLLLMDESVRIEQCDEAQEIRRDHQLIGDRRQRVGPDTAFFLLGLRSVIPETTHHFIKDTQDLQETEIRYGDEIGKAEPSVSERLEQAGIDRVLRRTEAEIREMKAEGVGIALRPDGLKLAQHSGVYDADALILDLILPEVQGQLVVPVFKIDDFRVIMPVQTDLQPLFCCID